MQYENQENTLNESYQYHAGLVECSLRKNGELIGGAGVSAPKVETPALEAPKGEPLKEEAPRLETMPTLAENAPIPVSTSVSNLAMMTYETDKKGYLAIKNQPLFVVARNFGFDFKQDRKVLAEHFGIKNYVGSYAQNMQIKNELLKLIVVK